MNLRLIRAALILAGALIGGSASAACNTNVSTDGDLSVVVVTANGVFEGEACEWQDNHSAETLDVSVGGATTPSSATVEYSAEQTILDDGLLVSDLNVCTTSIDFPVCAGNAVSSRSGATHSSRRPGRRCSVKAKSGNIGKHTFATAICRFGFKR